MYDTQEYEKNGTVRGACGVPQELKRFGTWAACGEWAYAAHPKGFRCIVPYV